MRDVSSKQNTGRLGRPIMEFDGTTARIYDDCKQGNISVAEASRQYKIPRSTLRYRLKVYEEREIKRTGSQSTDMNKCTERIVIYGAQAIAFSSYKAMAQKGNTVLFFVVTNKEGNPDRLEDIEVISLDDFISWCDMNNEYPKVYIATPEAVQQEITDTLNEHNYENAQCVDSAFFGDLMSSYYSSLGLFPELDAEKYIADNVAIYQTRSENDNILKKLYPLNMWTHTIQGGVSHCLRFVNTEFLDNTGDNISDKNCNYSELSALYWAWKNSDKPVIGLEHYRRYLRVSEADLLMLISGEVDVVLPFPMVYTPDISQQRPRWIKETDWQAVKQALQELAPAYAVHVDQIDSQPYYLNYNIIIARKDVLDQYCSFLFPILERVEELTDGANRHDRYIGYIGEYLCTLYFLMKEKQGEMKIRHAAAMMRV